MRQRVIFAYRGWHRDRGAVVLRTKQMSQILEKHFGGAFVVETAPIRRPRFVQAHDDFLEHAKGAVVIGNAHALRSLGHDRLVTLRHSSAGLCMDHVDSIPYPEDLGVYHVHILASHAGCRRVKARLAKNGVSSSTVAHVTHHADLRNTRSKRGKDCPFQVGYLGNPKNMVAPPDASQVSILSYGNQHEFEAALGTFLACPLHYAVRTKSHSRNVSKPFTKGFTAAAMGANIIVDRQTDDAEFYLGPDYPFLLNSSQPEDIAAGLEHAKEVYGSAEWDRGLDVIEHVWHLSNPKFVAAELSSAIHMAMAIAKCDSH